MESNGRMKAIKKPSANNGETCFLFITTEGVNLALILLYSYTFVLERSGLWFNSLVHPAHGKLQLFLLCKI